MLKATVADLKAGMINWTVTVGILQNAAIVAVAVALVMKMAYIELVDRKATADAAAVDAG